MAHASGFSRRMLLQTIALGALAGCATGAGGGAAGAPGAIAPPVAPPVAPRVPFRIEQLGRVRNDPYRWMKFIPETGTREMGNLPDMIRTHLEAEAAYAGAVLAPARALAPEIAAQMAAHLPRDEAPPPVWAGDWAYASHYPEGSGHAVYTRVPAEAGAVPEVLLEEAARAEGHAYYRTTGHQPSPDHRYFAWAEDVIGNDRHRICVKDTETGAVSVLVPEDAYGYGGLVFSPSSRFLFWIWRDARNRPTRIYRTPVDGGEAVLVHEETNPALFMQIKRTAAGGYIAITLSGPDMSEVWLVPAEDETDAPRVVFPRREKVRYEIEEWGGALLVLTDEGGAIDNTLLAMPAGAPQETLVAHRPGSQIMEVFPFEKALVRLERQDGLHQLILLFADGSEKAIGFDEAAYTLSVPAGQAYEAGQCRILFQSPRLPVQWMDVDLETGALSLVQASGRAGYDPDAYVVERMFAPAPDGALVPVTLLSRRGAPRDGSMPCVLYGYGAYGVSSDPEFSVPALALVDRGWTYAIAHVRGGSERGRQWFLDGRRFSKRNSFTDFVACAEHLCDLGVTRKGAVVAYGLSAGGLLVAGAMNAAPDMWAGVIAQVPFVDMLNTMSDADHPLVPLFRPDWGDPLADPVAYDYMFSISPYENVQATAYPPLLCTSGLKDDRVGYWEAAKLVAEVRHTSTGTAPAILLLDADAGHQSSGSRSAQFQEMSLYWAFAEAAVSGAL
ncbi:MAG: S9 family peptidase [Hyphomonas sp.]